MPSVFPEGYDTFPIPGATSKIDEGYTHSELHRDLGLAIEAIETTLGINPQSGYTTIAERINAIIQGAVTVDILELAYYSESGNNANLITPLGTITIGATAGSFNVYGVSGSVSATGTLNLDAPNLQLSSTNVVGIQADSSISLVSAGNISVTSSDGFIALETEGLDDIFITGGDDVEISTNNPAGAVKLISAGEVTIDSVDVIANVSNSVQFFITNDLRFTVLDDMVASITGDITFTGSTFTFNGSAVVTAGTVDEFARDAVGTALVAGEGIDITINDGSNTITIDAELASDTNPGVAEAGTIAETSAGTDAARYVTPDGLAGSIFGTEIVGIEVFAAATAVTTGDGKIYFRCPNKLNGMNLVSCAIANFAKSTSGTVTAMLARGRQAAPGTAHAFVDMLSTAITVDANEFDSKDATTAFAINASNDDIATGDLIRIDVDVAGTAATGLWATMTFQLP